MEGRRLVVVEANEVPRRVIEDVAATGRVPFLSSLLSAGRLVETRNHEELGRELYPSQTWASMNIGSPHADHGVYWYGDPKPADQPMYWQVAAAAGRSVGLVNTLHSSPLAERCADGDYRFVIPDCFGTDDETLPTRYREFQRLNLALTKANSRKAGLKVGGGLGPAELSRLARCLPHLGLRPRTVAEAGALIAGVASGRVPRERLRSGQFLLLKDLFFRLLKSKQPDLGVFFTNHVAAAMHRYWYALYPGDFERSHYGPEWIERYRDEIPHALGLLDRFLIELGEWCRTNDRTLVVVSSMGQGPSPRLDDGADLSALEAAVTDPSRFLRAIGVGDEVRVVGSMTPQLTLECDGERRASETASTLLTAGLRDEWTVDRRGSVITVTYRIEVIDASTVRVGDAVGPADEVGVTVHEVDDHSSGRHIPLGILGVENSPNFGPRTPDEDYIDVMEFAPAALRHLGLDPAPHHRDPAFRL